MYKLKSMARQFGLATLLLVASAAAIPQQAGNRYTVEIIVFRSASQTGALPGTTPRPLAGDDVEPALVTTRRLAASADRLRKAAGYRVLAHTAWTQGTTGFNSRRGVSATRLGLQGAGITGKIMVERGQYLHMGIDLTIDDGGRSYHISEVRQVKAGETQYFDHPAVGVIAVVTAGG